MADIADEISKGHLYDLYEAVPAEQRRRCRWVMSKDRYERLSVIADGEWWPLDPSLARLLGLPVDIVPGHPIALLPRTGDVAVGVDAERAVGASQSLMVRPGQTLIVRFSERTSLDVVDNAQRQLVDFLAEFAPSVRSLVIRADEIAVIDGGDQDG